MLCKRCTLQRKPHGHFKQTLCPADNYHLRDRSWLRLGNKHSHLLRFYNHTFRHRIYRGKYPAMAILPG